jgi:hypothetical protein
MGDLSTDARLDVVVAMVMSLVFTIVAAPFARAAYHRRVQRLMTFREVRSPPAAWWVRREGHVGRSAIAANVIEAEHPAELAQTMRYRL